MKSIATLVLLAVAVPALAGEPDEATKIRALKHAYHLNGDSVVGYGRTIDLSGGLPPDEQPDLNMEDVQKFIRRFNEKNLAIPDPEVPPLSPSPFKPPPQDMTDRVWADAPARVQIDLVDPRKFNEIDAMTSVHMDSVCKRHGLHKVMTSNGKSWKCR